MMSRISVYPLLFAFFASVLSAFGSPVPVPADSEHRLEKRARTGRATYFDVGMGNCGKRNKNSDFIVALATNTYARGSHCDKHVKITDIKTGKTATAMVRDSCPGCGPNDLDMSPSLFEHFEPLSKGTFRIKWSFL